ncbi:hypothetical protein AX774_g3863 [Zancudomyces culisetae]|uniref:Enhancer of translation termination 1 n=1 Tax=Zancudomyces culisetae TaxID=1213189 RepID=A0A1R1PNW1_ZANCU|nr:hypothetical protein AX774_g3863 [Zancudomyces culisetae]|eukprot:OMH82648.1 hypothetical protein AX774_g3863 [Zancudomyces culisetae]
MSEGMKKEKRKPAGLKSSAEKRAKVDDNVRMVRDFEDERTATVVLKNVEGENVNEVDEIEEIYNNALEEVEDDKEKAVMLLSGTVHECNRIIQTNDGAKDKQPLPYKLYYLYGISLFDLSELDEPEDALEYLKLSLERLSQAKDIHETQVCEEKDTRIYVGLGKVNLSIARKAEKEKDVIESLNSSLMYFKTAFDALEAKISRLKSNEEQKKEYTTEIYNIIDLLLLYCENNPIFEAIECCSEFITQKLEELKKTTNTYEPHFFSAQLQWCLALYYLNLLDQSATDDDKDEGHDEHQRLALEKLEMAEKHLNSCVKSAADPASLPRETYIMFGEVLLNKGNLLSDSGNTEEEQYRLAAKKFKMAIDISAGDTDGLPEYVLEFVEEWL